MTRMVVIFLQSRKSATNSFFSRQIFLNALDPIGLRPADVSGPLRLRRFQP